MFCPFCRHPDSRVVDSRTSDDGTSIRRRRQCPNCGRRFSTTETASLARDQAQRCARAVQPREDHLGCAEGLPGAPVTDGDLAVLAQKVEESVRASGPSQIEANDIGLAILPPLRELDEVAYLRFASVYQAFDSLEDFESSITQLRDEHAGRPRPTPRRSTSEDSLPRPLRTVFARMDPEDAHHFAFRVIRAIPRARSRRVVRRRLTGPAPSLAVETLGLTFASPFGVAAGFDKDAKGIAGLGSLGFGHVEVGTITAKPQPGNERPRLFRLVARPRGHQPHGVQQRRRPSGRRADRRLGRRPAPSTRHRRQHRQEPCRRGRRRDRRLPREHAAARSRWPTTSRST